MSGFQFKEEASAALTAAHDLAIGYAHSQLQPIHLVVSLIDPLPDQPRSTALLFEQIIERARGDVPVFSRSLKKALVRLPSQDPPPDQVSLSAAMSKVLRAAQEVAKSKESSLVEAHHLIQALAQDAAIQKCLDEAGIPKHSLIDEAILQILLTRKSENVEGFTTNLTEKARFGEIDPVLGYEEEVQRLLVILSRRTKNNPVLICDSGLGRQYVANALALEMINRNVPGHIADFKLLALDVRSVVLDSKEKGEFDQMRQTLKGIGKSADDVILFIDDIDLLLGIKSSSDGSITAGDLLQQLLSQNRHRCVGAISSNGKKAAENSRLFRSYFSPVFAKEPSVADITAILRDMKVKYESFHGVAIRDEAISAAATLATKHLPPDQLPESAVDLIDEAAATARVAKELPPKAIGNIERRLKRLQLEIDSLSLEPSNTAQERIRDAQRQSENLREEMEPLREAFLANKDRDDNIRRIKMKLQDFKAKMEMAERNNDYTMAADLKYYAIPDIEQQIKDLETAKAKTEPGDIASSQKDEIGQDEVTKVLERWTGKSISAPTVKAASGPPRVDLDVNLYGYDDDVELDLYE